MTRLYPAMAFTNIKKNRKAFIPYMLSCIVTVAIFYIVCSLAENEGMSDLWGGNVIQSYMGMGQTVVAIFAFIFLFYINSFLTKRRKSEFGIYNILGMEKRHIVKVIGLETFYVFLIVMALGILAGILLDRLMYLVIMRLFDAVIPLGFCISASAICKSFALFGVIFCFMLISSMWQIRRAKPVELLRSDNVGEREPKARWLIALLGCICLVSGYVIAVMTKNPVAAVFLFFIAVILVVIGTYLVFTAGSIAFLKILRKNKGYYYKTKHFISVSGMMYRMKRNAVGLANICILSTMVLVMISAVLSMYLGLDDSFRSRFPSELSMTAKADDPTIENNIRTIEQSLAEEGLSAVDAVQYRELSITAVYDEEKNIFVVEPGAKNFGGSIRAFNQLRTLCFAPLADYNESMGTSETLGDGEALVYSSKTPMKGEAFHILGQDFTIKKTLDDFMKNDNMAAHLTSGYFVVVRDMDAIGKLDAGQREVYGEYSSFLESHYMADVKSCDAAGAKDETSDAGRDGNASAFGNDDAAEGAAEKEKSSAGENEELTEAVCAAYSRACDKIYGADADTSAALVCRSVEKESYGADFIGLFFIGIFLGVLFIMATVLIMYYKQITEGYEDKKRFEILQNVGMSHQEVKRSISAQILIVFFLPLVTAGIHVAFEFPFMARILMLMNLFNLRLFACCTIGCFLVFGVFYTVVYLLTARLYYGIVKK